MNVSGVVRFRSSPAVVYTHVARSVIDHAVDAAPDPGIIERGGTLLTRYHTRLWRWTIVTTEEATLQPGRSVTWRHVDGPLTGSVETFQLDADGEGTLARYSGRVRARSRWFRGLGDRFFVAPMTRRISMASLRQARNELARTIGPMP